MHIIPYFIPGGAENQLKLLIENDTEYNHIIVPLRKSLNQFNIENKNIRIISLNIKYNPISWFYSLYKLVALIIKYKPSIIHGWMYHAQFITIFLKIFYRCKYIWCIRHGTFSKSTKRTTKLISNINAIFSNSVPNFIIYNSESGKKVHENRRYNKSKGLFIYNAGNDNFKYIRDIRSKQRKEWKINENDFLIGFVARYSPQKGVKVLLDSYKNSLGNNKDVKLVICGKGMDWENIELTQYLKELNIYQRVILNGQVSNINPIMNAIDIYISTSLYGEAFPNVILEASYTGLPIIASNVGDTYKILDSKDSLVEPNDKKTYSSLLMKYYNKYKSTDSSIIDQEREKNSKNKHNYFSCKEMVERYRYIWRDLICI
mgnify:CR=1 FL=1|tara:strand:+ start:4756 stop:5877 length:1122 start_codon:yes stop_codon:yes gene_type:complete